MKIETTATFIGHSDCYRLSKTVVKSEIEKLINMGIYNFISGGQGSFDRICARCVYELKAQYPQIKNYLVIPYLNFRVFDKEIFDCIIYPEGFEKLHFKAAIIAKNNYLIDNSSYALCYIRHTWGGAAKTYKKAIDENLTIIDI